jgi:hypothetical protein
MGNRLEKAKFIGHADSGCMLASELKLRFDQGFHDEAIIVREPMTTDNYNVAIKGRGYWVYVSAARTKTTPKSYKSLDAAMSEIQKIGFQAASIDIK